MIIDEKRGYILYILKNEIIPKLNDDPEYNNIAEDIFVIIWDKYKEPDLDESNEVILDYIQNKVYDIDVLNEIMDILFYYNVCDFDVDSNVEVYDNKLYIENVEQFITIMKEDFKFNFDDKELVKFLEFIDVYKQSLNE